MAPVKESELKVSEKRHVNLLKRTQRKVKQNGIEDLKRLEAVLQALVNQAAKLKAKMKQAKHNRSGELRKTMSQLREVNRRLVRFNVLTQLYTETKLADPAWDAANTSN